MLGIDKPGIVKRRGSGADDETTGHDFEGDIAGVCDRTMRRMREGYQQFGYTGLMDRRSRALTGYRSKWQRKFCGSIGKCISI